MTPLAKIVDIFVFDRTGAILLHSGACTSSPPSSSCHLLVGKIAHDPLAKSALECRFRDILDRFPENKVQGGLVHLRQKRAMLYEWNGYAFFSGVIIRTSEVSTGITEMASRIHDCLRRLGSTLHFFVGSSATTLRERRSFVEMILDMAMVSKTIVVSLTCLFS